MVFVVITQSRRVFILKAVCLQLRVRWYLPWVNRGNDAIMKLNCSTVPPGDGRIVTAFPQTWPYYIRPSHW